MKRTITGTAAIALGFSASTAMAATLHDVTISSVVGEWVLPGPSTAFGVDIETTDERTQILWGKAPTGGSQSGYEFDGIDTPANAAPGTEFNLGLFSHFNNPIYTYPGDGFTTAITEVNLKLDFNFLIGGQDYFLSKIFDFKHDETPNEGGAGGACAYGGTSGVGPDAAGCRDHVSIGDSMNLTDRIVVDGLIYTFNLEGFKVGNETLEFFLTEENSINEAFLVGSYSVSQVPLPAAGWMLLAGFGGLVAMKRRKAKAQA